MVTTTASYQSAVDKRLYFGIGQDNAIRSVEILWPSGTRQVIRDPAVRKIIRITEPSASAAR